MKYCNSFYKGRDDERREKLIVLLAEIVSFKLSEKL